MQCGDTVDSVAADRGEIRHAHALAALLADQGHASHPRLVAREARMHFIQEPAIDLVDDLEVTRQKLAEHRQGPGLQSLRQQGVVGVAQRRHGDCPRVIPLELPLVYQEPHQLGDRDRRMRVVELQCPLFGERLNGAVGNVVVHVQHVLQRTGDEEVLLQQAQLLTDLWLVVRVEHLGYRLRDDFLLDRLVVLAGVEGLDFKRLDRFGAP